LARPEVVDLRVKGTTFQTRPTGATWLRRGRWSCGCVPRSLSPGKSLGKITTANNNLALAA